MASAATTVVAALTQAAGVQFEIADEGETIPLFGISFVSGVFSVLGSLIAAALLRWSAHPAKCWVQVAVILTAISPTRRGWSRQAQARASPSPPSTSWPQQSWSPP